MAQVGGVGVYDLGQEDFISFLRLSLSLTQKDSGWVGEPFYPTSCDPIRCPQQPPRDKIVLSSPLHPSSHCCYANDELGLILNPVVKPEFNNVFHKIASYASQAGWS